MELSDLPVDVGSLALLPVASAHGRFQPFHLGHLEYLQASKQRCDFLWIGITQYLAPTVQATTPEDVHRSMPQNNPLTYFERADLIRLALMDAGISGSEYGFVPFPIEEPALLHNFLDPAIPIFTTVYDDWNRHKVDVLRRHGYQVHVLWERHRKDYAGAAIRSGMLAGNSEWHSMVPRATLPRLAELQIGERLKRLVTTDH